MFRPSAPIAVVLSLTFFLDTGRTVGAGKPDPVVERIADQLATYAVLHMGFGKKVKDFAVGRFSACDGLLERKLAQCLLIAYPQIEKRPVELRLVKAQLALDAEVLTALAKDDKYAALLIQGRSATLAAENKGDARKTFDEWEIKYGATFNAESAAALVRWSAMMETIIPAKLIEARTQLKMQLVRRLADDPKLVKDLVDALKPTEEVRKSRERVMEMMEKAK